MKKFTSFLLMLTMLISIIYLPGLTLNISAAETLPDGSSMMTVNTTYTNNLKSQGYTAITSTTDFENIPSKGGKFYLTKSISFGTSAYTKSLSGPIIFDGCGCTITDIRALFSILPAGSEIRNLVIAGDMTSVTANWEGNNFGALARVSKGAYIKNVINKANITYAPKDDNNKEVNLTRLGGLIGAVQEGTTFFENCMNTGTIIGGNNVAASTSAISGVGGILGYVHDGASKALLLNCKNDAPITTRFSNRAYAGGLVGAKHADGELLILNCTVGSNNSTSYYNTNNTVNPVRNKGTYFSQQNTTGYEGPNPSSNNNTYNATAISSASQLSNLSGSDKYYLTTNISGVPANKSNFTGKIFGFNRSITYSSPPTAEVTRFTSRELTINVSGWTRITTPQQFYAIKNDGSANANNRYCLGANINLASAYPNWAGPAAWSGSEDARDKAVNSRPTIVLDGCGYTITTSKPIFPELPGGGAGNEGTHSTIRNLVIAGTVTVNSATTLADKDDTGYSATSSYNNGRSVGALVGKSKGGIYENITNNANVVVDIETNARVGGIIGSVFNDDIVMTNCVNNGTVTAKVSGNLYGIGGIVGLIGYNENGSARGVNAKLINCTNNKAVKNNSTAASHVYAGGIVGVKYTDDTVAYIIDCLNKGKVFAKTAYGSYYANRLQQNIHIVKTTPISTAEEFMNISGKRAYSLANDITITSCNTNYFKGFLVGNGHSVTTPDRLFENAPESILLNVGVKPNNLVINGRKLDTYAIVAATASDTNAVSIQNHIKNNYGKTLPIKTPADNYKGNAIYINLGNDYYVSGTDSGKHRTRFGFDYGENDDGYFEIYLDGKDAAATTALVNDFITNKIPAGKSKSGYDFFAHFGDKKFNYVFGDGLSSGITINKDLVRSLDDGVTYIERTYTNAQGVSVETCIIVIKAGADVHLEVAAAQTTKVSSCTNNAEHPGECGNLHVSASAQKTTGEFANSLQSKGKDVMAAMNGGYFMKSAGCNTPWGTLIVDGNVIREPWEGRSGHGSRWFGITYDGTPVCGDYKEYNNNYKGKNKLQYAVDGKYYLIKNGNYVQASSIDGNTDARTAIGFNAKGDIVMVSVAGNDKNAKHPGLSLADLAQVFMDLDMDITYALNLDGGGSTAMMVDDANGTLHLETPQYSSDYKDSAGNIDETAQRKITDALVLVRNEK